MITHFSILTGLLFFALNACTLSARQEEHLNEQLGRYVKAHNDGRLLEVIGLTHPAVVKYYRPLGDTLFIQHFRDDRTYGKTYFGNPTYREMKEKVRLIQRRYTLEYFSDDVGISRDYRLYALSEDGGDNWFFVRNEDYEDSNITGFERLFH